MKQETFKIVSQKQLTSNVFRMSLIGDIEEDIFPGQFVNIKIDGLFLRRPISVCDVYGNTLTLVYKVVGAGTKAMSKMSAGDELDLLLGLGNGYCLDNAGDRPLLVGGGVGVPPLLYLAKELKFRGKNPIVIMGFNTVDEIFLFDEFKSRGFETIVTTVDGSFGEQGFVTDVLADLDYTYFYACGPEPMLKALYSATKTSGELSFEERMGCGFGACMGCSCKTITGNKRICKEGPVLKKEEIIWED